MKKFLIDTYRIFLLQISKIIWDIVGLTILTWFIYIRYPYPPRFSTPDFHIVYITTAGIWLVIRLYWPRNRKKAEEIEALRPVSPFATSVSKLIIISLFFVLNYIITSYIFYNYRLVKVILWFNSEYSLRPSDLNYTRFKNPLVFWRYIIPVAVAMRLKLIPRIIFIFVFLLVIYFFIPMNVLPFDARKFGFIHQTIAFIIYLIMLVYLIIPKRINFK